MKGEEVRRRRQEEQPRSLDRRSRWSASRVRGLEGSPLSHRIALNQVGLSRQDDQTKVGQLRRKQGTTHVAHATLQFYAFAIWGPPAISASQQKPNQGRSAPQKARGQRILYVRNSTFLCVRYLGPSDISAGQQKPDQGRSAPQKARGQRLLCVRNSTTLCVRYPGPPALSAGQQKLTPAHA